MHLSAKLILQPRVSQQNYASVSIVVGLILKRDLMLPIESPPLARVCVSLPRARACANAKPQGLILVVHDRERERERL